MSKEQKRTFLILLALGLVYFALFIPANFTGARDANMLGVFEVDELAQYPHVIDMLTPGPTLYQTVRNFLIYLHYFYGYPFYFLSALVILPVKWIFAGGWTAHTALIVLVLRQMINVLPIEIAVTLLVYLQTRFKSLWKSLALFVLLLATPGLIANNLWWHPDSLAVLAVVLVFFFLDCDEQRFGKHFFIAALICGVAVGVKYMGVFFCLAVPLYLAWGLHNRVITWKRALALAAEFVGLMVVGLLVSNPLLLLPQERAEIISVQQWQFEQTRVGIMMKNTQPYFQWGSYPATFRAGYGELLFVLAALGGLVVGIVNPKKRLPSLMLLVFALPLLYTIDTSAIRRPHYFLPVMLPLTACLGYYFDDQVWDGLWSRYRKEFVAALARSIPWVVAVGILMQMGAFVWSDVSAVQSQMNREQTAAGIQFFDQVDSAYLSKIPANQHLTIYHDWHLYVPARPHWQVELNWNLANQAYIDDLKPDLIFLEQANLALFTQAGAVDQAVNRGEMADWQTFYDAAAHDQVKGYQKVYENNDGLLLAKTSLAQQYFSK
jgi:hypothetical protein